MSGSGLPEPLAVLELLPDPLVAVDGSGTVVWANRTAAETFGWQLDEVAGRSGLDLLHPDDFATALVSLASVQSKEIGTTVEVRVRTADDSFRLCEVRGRTLRDHPSGWILLSIRDITDRRRWEVAAGDSDVARAVIQHAPVITLLTDGDGRIRSSSAALVRELGHSLESAHGRFLVDLVAEADRAEVRRTIEAAQGGGRHGCEAALLAADGVAVRGQLTIVGLLSDPVVAGLIVSVQDISALADARERLRHLATHDPLTGLANRSLLYETLGQRLARGPAALVYADLDGFKPVNDRLGHLAGDMVLRGVGARLAAFAAADELIARVGGDEFVVVTEPARAEARARELADELAASPIELGDVQVALRASIGVAVARPGDEPDQLLAAADAAMYRAKVQAPGD